MPEAQHERRCLRWLAAALCCSASGFCAAPPLLANEVRTSISVGVPDGFAELERSQELLVDVYFGGIRIGDAIVEVSPGTLSLKSPAAVVAKLPAVADQPAVTAALSVPALASNAALACGKGADKESCGRLAPDIAGVIFDRERYRLDVFVAPRFLEAQPEIPRGYLALPQAALSAVDAISGFVAGSTGSRDNSLSLQNNLIVAAGASRLRMDLSLASARGITADNLLLEFDRPELRYLAGATWAPGGDLTVRRKVLGAGLMSQTDTRLDHEQLLGSPIVVFLEQRARVELLREGRVVHSAIYDAGNQEIDTSALPEGSYDIVVRVEEQTGRSREERRYFTKNLRRPPAGRTDFFGFGGVTLGRGSSYGDVPEGRPFFTVGALRGLTDHLALGGSVEVVGSDAALEVSANLATPVAQLRSAALIGTRGESGVLLQLQSGTGAHLNFNLDMRHVNGTASSGFGPGDDSLHVGVAEQRGSYSQITGVVAFALPDVRFLGTGSYRRGAEDAVSYNLGPAVEVDLLRRGPLLLTARTELAITERGEAGFAGLSLRLIGRRASVSAAAGLRRSSAHADGGPDGAVASLSASVNPGLTNADLRLGASLEHQPSRDSEVVSADLRSALGSIAGQYLHSSSAAGAEAQYTLGFQTTVAAAPGTLALAGLRSSQSMVVAEVSGAPAADRFEVLVDGQAVGITKAGSPLSLQLPPYRAYRVRVRPVDGGLVAFDSSDRSVALYPGTVAKVHWTAAPLLIQFGKLVSPDGRPLVEASITGAGVWSETDETGAFELEAPAGAELTVTTRDGDSFAVVLPRRADENGVVQLGSLECHPAVRFGMLVPAPVIEGREAK